jgi:hypothetical protein
MARQKQPIFKVAYKALGGFFLAYIGVYIIIIVDSHMPTDSINAKDLAACLGAVTFILIACSIFASILEES